MIIRTGSVAALILFAGCATQSGHLKRSLIPEARLIALTTSVEGEYQPAALYVPEDYDSSREWPLVVFLHGMGERGNDGLLQTEVGIGPVIRDYPEWFPCLVLMPQCSEDYVWTTPKGMAHIDAAVGLVTSQYAVDDERVSLTGLSMGGFGAFLYGARNVDRFSAILPVCGGGDPGDAAELARVPMRVFHGEADDRVPVSRSRTMVEAIRAAGGAVEYVEYPGVSHNSWDLAYGDPENIAWLLAQRRDAE